MIPKNKALKLYKSVFTNNLPCTDYLLAYNKEYEAEIQEEMSRVVKADTVEEACDILTHYNYTFDKKDVMQLRENWEQIKKEK